jgi:hypothetical protein
VDSSRTVTVVEGLADNDSGRGDGLWPLYDRGRGTEHRERRRKEEPPPRARIRLEKSLRYPDALREAGISKASLIPSRRSL